MNIDDTFGRKRTSTEDHHVQTFSTSGKRLRIISEASLATALNEEDDEIEEEIQPVRVSSKRGDSHHVQPKVETLEFLEEAAQHIQQSNKQPQNITYMNMDSFTEKTNTATNQQQQTTVTRNANSRIFIPVTNDSFVLEYVQAGTSQQQQQQSAAVDYKSGWFLTHSVVVLILRENNFRRRNMGGEGNRHRNRDASNRFKDRSEDSEFHQEQRYL